MIRLGQDRCALREGDAEEDDPTIDPLNTLARLLPAPDGRAVQIPASCRYPAREALVHLSRQHVRLLPAAHTPGEKRPDGDRGPVAIGKHSHLRAPGRWKGSWFPPSGEKARPMPGNGSHETRGPSSVRWGAEHGTSSSCP